MVRFPGAVSFFKAPDRLWIPPSRISNEYSGKRSFSQGVKRMGPEADEVLANILCRSQVDGDK